MSGAMLQFRHRGATAPTPAEVRRRFGLADGELDPEFGVIATDPGAGLYTVLIAAAAVDRVARSLAGDDPAEAVFANPPVEPFGPS